MLKIRPGRFVDFLLRPGLAAGGLLLTLAGTATAAQPGSPVSRHASVRAIAELPVEELPAVNPAERLNEDAATEPGPLRYAIPVDTSVTPDNAGTWEKLSDGARLWRYRVHAPGATDLSFGFTRYHLPRGATLHVISEKQDYFHGPYTHVDNRDHGQHWTPMVPGDSAVIELYLPADFVSRTRRAKPQNAKLNARGSVRADWLDLELGRVGTGYRDLFGTPNLTRQGDCNIDTICPQGDNWRDEIRSAAMYSIGAAFLCSGTIIMDVPRSFTPWWITANSCGVNAGNAASLVVLWNFESAVCGALTGGIALDTQSGASWRAAGAGADFTLLELSTPPNPAFDVYYSGWDATGAVPQSSMGISHPNNDEKALAINVDPLTTTASCIGGVTPDTHWNVDNYELGMTEQGSSGSGIWNPYGTDPLVPNNPKLVGVLSGGTAVCNGNMPDTGFNCYGKFSVAYSDSAVASENLVSWLDPGGVGTLMVDGADPGGSGAICGNAILETDEQCDDGNDGGGDGCSATCQLEAGFGCSLPIPGAVINGLPDGGFEAGTPSPVWAEASTNFGTPLCTATVCGDGGGSGPNSGLWWAWFGGVAGFEAGSVEQTFDFQPTDTEMTFAVENADCDSGSDFARVLIDGNEVYSVTGADPTCGVVGYRTITIDLVNAPGGPYNNGSHALRVESESFAVNSGSSNFFFDDFTINRGSIPPQPSVCTPLGIICSLEDFDSGRGAGLAGWTVFNDGAVPWDWGTTDDGVCGSMTSPSGNHAGTGIAACVDSDAAGSGVVNSYLCSPSLDLGTVAGANLEFRYNFQVLSATGEDAFEVLVGTDPPNLASIGAYTSKFFTAGDAGTFGAGPGVSTRLDISENDGLSSVYLCYRYGGDFDWYAQVDDVAITANDCSAAADTDQDGVTDDADNCTLLHNPDQIDTNEDGIGNQCDPDLDGNCVVDFSDLLIFKSLFFTTTGDPAWNPDADFRGPAGGPDGQVNFSDLGTLKVFFFGPPGPSATGCN